MKDNVQSTHILKLQGSWQADRYNRLTFRIKKEGPGRDVLIFNGAWKINKHHRITYQYQKSRFKRRKRQKRALIFNGYWEITKKYRLSYMLDLKGKSCFLFQTSSVFLGKNSIRCEAGIRISGRKRPVKRVVMIFGRWKIRKNLGLLFEIEYEKGKIHAIRFGIKGKLAKTFLTLLGSKKELRIYAGMAWGW